MKLLGPAFVAIKETWRLRGRRGVLEALGDKIYWEGRYVRLRVDLATWVDQPEPPGPLEVRRGSLAELARYREARPWLPVQFYEDRLHGARQFYAGYWNGELAHVSWVFTHEDRTPQVALAPGEAELNGAYTVKEFRGKGLLPAVERAILRDLRCRGFATAYTHVSVDNVSSLRGVAKAGFRPVGVLTWRWVFGLSIRRFEPDRVAPGLRPRTAFAR